MMYETDRRIEHLLATAGAGLLLVAMLAYMLF